MRAWLNAPGRSAGRAAAAQVRKIFLFFASSISKSEPVNRLRMRRTLPSTAGMGTPKAMDRMAPAV